MARTKPRNTYAMFQIAVIPLRFMNWKCVNSFSNKGIHNFFHSASSSSMKTFPKNIYSPFVLPTVPRLIVNKLFGAQGISLHAHKETDNVDSNCSNAIVEAFDVGVDDGLLFMDDEKFEDFDNECGEEESQFESSGEKDSILKLEKERNTELYQTLFKSVEMALQLNDKKKKSLKAELDKAQHVEEKYHLATLITSNLYRLHPGITSIDVEDWEKNDGQLVTINFDTDTYSSPQEEAEAMFSQARKMKRGSIIVKDLMLQNEDARDVLISAKLDLERIYEDNVESFVRDDGFAISDGSNELTQQKSCISFAFNDLLAIETRLIKTQQVTKFKMLSSTQTQYSVKKRPASKSSSKKQTPNPRKIISPHSGLHILVGRNRRDNEYLSLEVAKKDDLWFHARGCPGAHVLLKRRRGDPESTDECLQLAANLAAFYSEARTERKAVITVAEPKHIQKPRGAPLGAVKIRKELPSMTGNPLDVPPELLQQRQENKSDRNWGYGEEKGVRSLGVKTKNRKKTETAKDQTAVKKRAERKEKRRNTLKTVQEIEPETNNGVTKGDWY